MGSWGFGVFEDDTALDELGDFVVRPSMKRLGEMLDAVTSKPYPDDAIASRALVAAELVAALRGRPSHQLPEDAKTWVAGESTALPIVLARKALRALAAVVRKSEVKDVWEDAGSLSQWRRSMDDLKRRLSAPPTRMASKAGASLPKVVKAGQHGGAAPKSGATYLIPLEDGYLGACRVIRPAAGDDLLGLMDDLPAKKREERAREFHVVVTSPWVGKEPPSLDEPQLRQVLRLTHHEWQDAPQVYVAPVDVPPDFRFIGYIPPSEADRALKGVLSTTWTRRGQQLLQRQWDEQHTGNRLTARAPGPKSGGNGKPKGESAKNRKSRRKKRRADR